MVSKLSAFHIFDTLKVKSLNNFQYLRKSLQFTHIKLQALEYLAIRAINETLRSFHNHGEGPNQDFLFFESTYQTSAFTLRIDIMLNGCYTMLSNHEIRTSTQDHNGQHLSVYFIYLFSIVSSQILKFSTRRTYRGTFSVKSSQTFQLLQRSCDIRVEVFQMICLALKVLIMDLLFQ